MDNHIDWISFTLQRDQDVRTSAELYHEAKERLRRVSDEHQRFVFDGQGYEVCASRAPYRFGLARNDNGVRLYGGDRRYGVLYEITGRACEGLRENEPARRFLSPLLETITRLDFACDVRCDVRPYTFANERAHRVFRSYSFIQSATGETVYVGSPKSDRFCRVYRYSAPHPRSALLRIEFVFRRGMARDAARALCAAQSEEDFVAQLGNSYGWTHKVWQPGSRTDERLRAAIVTRGNEDTVNWLYKQVSPAIRRLLDEEALDLAAWLEYTLSGAEK